MEANKLTTKSQEALSAAVRHSVDRGNPAVEPAHLLGALLAQTDGTAGPLLRAVGADLTDVRAENDALQGRLPRAVPSPSCCAATVPPRTLCSVRSSRSAVRAG